MTTLRPSTMRRLDALGTVTPCTVCGEPSVDGIHPNCAEPSVWPTSLTEPAPATSSHSVRRCQVCHGKGWTLPTNTRPACTHCNGTGTTPWRTR